MKKIVNCRNIFNNFNYAKMNRLLDNNNRKTRNKLKNLFKKDVYKPRYNLSLNQERDLAYERLRKLCKLNVVSVKDFWDNPKNIFTTHEVAGMCDGSLCTKLTVQFNLFGGTVLKLGTDYHHNLCNDIDNLNLVGCFGLTELGYGNNAVEMETTATYDKKNKEFVINTPSTKAQKYWITNGAVHAHHCVVFARLIIDDKDEGLHGFLVPIRDNNLKVKNNVKIWDMGYKIGLNGIDNAALWFDNVRIPEKNLLNATSTIDENGNFISNISDNSERKRKRFLVLADQLLSGRVCIASMCLGSTKMTLDTTIKYAHSRLAVGKSGFSDTAIINYQLQKNTLMPLIAKTYALNFLLNYVQDRYEKQNEEDYNEVVRLCCIVKPLISWHAENTATTCRERCGGQGFLAANRFGEAIAGSHAGITAEGDNRVILQKVAKECLSEVNKNDLLLFLSQRKISKSIIFKYYSNLDDYKSFLKLFELRNKILLYDLAYDMYESKNDIYDTWMYEKSDNIQDLATSYGENIVVNQFFKVIEESDDELRETLIELYKVYCLTLIKENIGFFIKENLINKKSYEKVNEELNLNNKLLAQKSLDLVKSFNIPDWMHHAPIANDWEEYNRTENNGELENQSYKI
jgi:acyl-CoA oxidase